MTTDTSRMPYRSELVTFDSHGLEITGRLYRPTLAAEPLAAVTILGPVGFVKEQSPQQYATRLAREGFAALVFDPRYHGQSAGEPRRWEHPEAKIADVRASLDYLARRDDVDASALCGLGVCQGVNWMTETSVRDSRIQRLAIVAGHYLTPATGDVYMGGPEKRAARIERALAAQKLFDEDGTVEYIPVVSADSADALLMARPVREWYMRWADRGPAWGFHGLWENRITRMSEAHIWGHDVGPVMES